MSRKRKRYTPAPEVPQELQARYQAILEVLSGRTSVSEAARRLGMPRNHFQTTMHRGLSGLIAGLQPKPPGRAPQPEKEAALERENERIAREKTHLQQRVETMDRLLAVASDILKGRVEVRNRPRQKRSRPPTSSTGKGTSDDDEAWLRRLLAWAGELRGLGLRPELVAAVVGVTEATLRRWRRRDRRGERLREHRGAPGAPPPPAPAVDAVRDLVRRTHGLVGAVALQRQVDGISRRQAARIKRDTLRRMGQEERASYERIRVAFPDVIRGSDAMHLRVLGGRRWLFVSSDGSVPWRTSIEALDRYDGASVARVLERDFATFGAPLVWRSDRASAHRVSEVDEVLRSFQVMRLHGPARYPRYYGQLERQNREHRLWLDAEGVLRADQLPDACARMRHALNHLWRRATLDWRTAGEAWAARPRLQVDRRALAEEVHERMLRLRRNLDGRRSAQELSQRLAIEQTLLNRGLLRREVGGWC